MSVDELDALIEQQDELIDLLRDLDDAGWTQPSRCEGWSVADVVLHMAQTNEMAIGSATDRFAEVLAALTEGAGPAADVDEGADRMVARDRGRFTSSGVFDRYTASAHELREVLGSADPHRRVTWVAGTLSVRTLTTTRLAETWIHTGDVADALGVALAPAPRLRHIARLAWRTLPYAFSRAGQDLHGPVAFHLTGPDGAEWRFAPDEPATTTVHGDGVELCLVAARRIEPSATSLVTDGPDGDDVLRLVRTYA